MEFACKALSCADLSAFISWYMCAPALAGALFYLQAGKENMIILNGKYNSAKIYTDFIEAAAASQIISLCDQPMTENSVIRIMPDVHAGAGCTIGTTMTIKDKVVPNIVGVDIGCGMEVAKLKEKHIELQKLDKFICNNIPSGFSVRNKPHRYAEQFSFEELYCIERINVLRAELSIGTLGGGNHFIEVDKSQDGALYLVIHSGSRHLGVETAKYYQEEAYRRLNKSSSKEVNELIERLKAEGRSKNIQSELKKLTNTKTTSVPKHLAYCEGKLFDEYIHDMKLVQHFASLNRQAMMIDIIKGMGLHVTEQFSTIHNYIDTDKMILRKGAVSAEGGEKLLIPINMRDGSLLCTGRGNTDWNCSAPHGAGRLMSRSEAKQSFTVSEFKKQMNGIYTSTVSASTLDECPMVYKSMDDIIGNIGDTVEINEIIRPVYNFKAGEEG